MSPLTVAWVQKVEGHFVSATELKRKTNPAVPNVVCFHCQPCAEKYLKARLQEAEIPFPKTHNLVELVTLLLPVEPRWEALCPIAQTLTNSALEFRYAGDSATDEEAARALELCRAIRHAIRISPDLERPQPAFRVREKAAPYRVPRPRKRKRLTKPRRA